MTPGISGDSELGESRARVSVTPLFTLSVAKPPCRRKLAACNRTAWDRRKVTYHGTHYSTAADPMAKSRPDWDFQASPLGYLTAHQSRGIEKYVRIGRNSFIIRAVDLRGFC